MVWSAFGLPPLCKTACIARRQAVSIKLAALESDGEPSHQRSSPTATEQNTHPNRLAISD